MGNDYKEPKFTVGDLVYYCDTFVIPPDAVNWKLNDTDIEFSHRRMGIVVEIRYKHWESDPLYRVLWVKNGDHRLCSAVNLRKVYPNDTE